MTLALFAVRGFAAIGVMLAIVGMARTVALALALAVGVWSALLVAPRLPMFFSIAFVGQELAIGAALGVAAAVPLVAARIAGTLVDRGAGVRGSYGGLLDVIAAAVFVGLDGHVAVVRAVVESHRALPALAGQRTHVLAALASLVPSALALALPWLVTATVIWLAIGVSSRVAARTAQSLPSAAGAAVVVAMMSAAFVSVFAVGVARMVTNAG
jgi:flagellar biosynthesis protein FliR